MDVRIALGNLPVRVCGKHWQLRDKCLDIINLLLKEKHERYGHLSGKNLPIDHDIGLSLTVGYLLGSDSVEQLNELLLGGTQVSRYGLLNDLGFGWELLALVIVGLINPSEATEQVGF